MKKEIKKYLLVKKVAKYSGLKSEIERILYMKPSDFAKKLALEEIKEIFEKAKEPSYNPDPIWGNKEDVVFKKLLDNPESLKNFGLVLQKEQVPLFFYILYTEGISVGGDELAYGVGGFREPGESSYSSEFYTYFDYFKDLFVAFVNNDLNGRRVQVFLEEKKENWKQFLKKLPEMLKKAQQEIEFLEKVNKEI